MGYGYDDGYEEDRKKRRHKKDKCRECHDDDDWDGEEYEDDKCDEHKKCDDRKKCHKWPPCCCCCCWCWYYQRYWQDEY